MNKNIFKRILRNRRKRSSGEINPEDIFLDSSNLAGMDMDRQEGTLNKPISRFMEYLPAIIIIIVFFLYIYRLYIIQVKDYLIYKEKADNNRYNSHLILANRGEIFDRNGKVLAENIVSSTTNILKREYIGSGGFANLLGYITYPKKDNLNNY